MCGWGKRTGKDSIENLMRKVEKALSPPPKRLKIYTSGSIFDESQFPRYFQLWLAEKIDRTCTVELQVESLPDYITYERLQPFLNRSYELIVALGLEVADNEALKELGKYPAMTVEKFISITLMLRNLGVKVKTYVLVNPPVPNWKKLFPKTMEIALKYSDEVVIINTYPHSESPLFIKWIRGEWHPLPYNEFIEVITPYLRDPRVQIEFNNFAFKPKFPKYLRKKIIGANEETLLHPYYEVWMEYLTNFYEPPKKDVLLFVPCSYRKPYYKSKTWKAILNVLRRVGMRRRTHLVAISSPGVIPEEFANDYPFNSYDWPEWEETEEIKKLYVDVIRERVRRFLKAHAHKYKIIAVYLKPDSESFKAVMEACKELGLSCIPCIPPEEYDEEMKSHKPPVTHPKALKLLYSCMSKLREELQTKKLNETFQYKRRSK
ncbi:hypothetical protein IPA_04795 [Ignicoccus pacificus DSM 13166]|uniref:DUF5591 domain-containing protein n=1 Tax=Ignicoccus pacificus DSM 13166 TaxID=940294 RepID=A0A977PLK8_9CREN|nr:hypothetical protein IPA_04795 [Ignicoccus pacificus DSM 13166]